jgi:hypothetical protein
VRPRLHLPLSPSPLLPSPRGAGSKQEAGTRKQEASEKSQSKTSDIIRVIIFSRGSKSITEFVKILKA